MPINVFGNSSNNSENRIDTSIFVPYLRTNYIESNIEEIDPKNLDRIKNLPDPKSIREAASKNYVDNLFKNDIDFNDVKSENINFVKVNYQPAVNEHLTPKKCINNATDEASLVRNIQDNDFNIYNLTNINSITLNKQAENDNEVIAKANVDQFHQENERSRRDLCIGFYNESSDLVKNNQDNDFNDNKVINNISITFNQSPTSDNEVSTKKYNDDELDKNTILRFSRTLENYLKVSVGNDTYNHTNYMKIQITDITIIKDRNIGKDLLQRWNIICNDKNNNSQIGNFVKSTKTSSPSPETGATIKPPIGDAFLYIETSSNNHTNSTFVILDK